MYVHRVDFGLVPSTTPLDSSSTSTDNSPATSQTNTGENRPPVSPPNIVWERIQRSRDGFQVELPTGSKEIQVPAFNERGGTEQVNMLYAYPDAYTSFSVAWADEPPVERVSSNNPDDTLDMARDDALSRTQTSLISETRANRVGYPARDFVARNSGGGVFNARLILVGHRLYMLIAAFPSESGRRDDDLKHFLDSFKISAKN